MAKKKHQIEVDEKQGYTQNFRDINVCGQEIDQALGFIKKITFFYNINSLTSCEEFQISAISSTKLKRDKNWFKVTWHPFCPSGI